MAVAKVPKGKVGGRPQALPAGGPSLYRDLLTKATDPAEIRSAITHAQIRGTALRQIRLALDLTIDDLADVLAVSKRTIARKERDVKATLSPAEADRAYRLARVSDLAVELIGDPAKAAAWMRTPNTYLGGEAPVRMLDTEIGTDLVVESLHAIAYGGVA